MSVRMFAATMSVSQFTAALKDDIAALQAALVFAQTRPDLVRMFLTPQPFPGFRPDFKAGEHDPESGWLFKVYLHLDYPGGPGFFSAEFYGWQSNEYIVDAYFAALDKLKAFLRRLEEKARNTPQ